MTEFGAVVSYRGVRLSVDTSESLGRSIFYFDDYESAHESAFVELASNRMVFDIGANVGVFTTLAALNGAKVIASEPSKVIRAILEGNVTLNGFAREVTIVSDAVSCSDEMMPFYETRPGNWGVGRVFSFGHSAGKSKDYEVHCDTIDGFVRRFGMPDVIKLDIEGAEFLALNGAGATLSAPNAPQLFIEFHPQEIMSLGGTLEHCLQLLLEHGYRRYEIVGSARPQLWFCFSKVDLHTKLFRICT